MNNDWDIDELLAIIANLNAELDEMQVHISELQDELKNCIEFGTGGI